MRINGRRRLMRTLVIAAVFIVLAVAWINRWRLGRAAVRFADPMVRSWATQQVLAASDSVYHLVVSTIRLDEVRRTISIDTVLLTTDTAANARLATPHAAISVAFHQCAITGIDLDLLASGGGLHAAHAGCDSVALLVRTLVPPAAGAPSAADADSNNFLRFQGKLDLPSSLPSITLDAVAFPHVHVAFDLIASDGRRTSLAVDSLAVGLDAVRIDPREPVAKRRPLFSRDIEVRLDRFEGSTTAAAHIALRHLTASLSGGTCRVDSIVYEPAPGRRADSLGFAALRVQHASFSGVRWRTFLLTGAISVGMVQVDTMRLRVVAPHHVRARFLHEATPTSLEATFRAVGESVQLDSLVARAIQVVETPAQRADSIVTTVDRLTVAHVAFGPDDADWTSPFPMGELTADIERLVRRTPSMTIAVASLHLDARARQVAVDAVHAAPEGDDAAFERRHPYRKSRLSVTMASAVARGIDLPAYLRRGALRATALEVRGLNVDVLKDKSKPEDPAPDITRRSPQGVLRDAGIEVQVDTATGDGQVTYRERDAGAARPGVLVFAAAKFHGYNFSTDPARMSARTPFRLVGDARLMGAGALHVEWDVPLLSTDFAMQWHGTLGPMDPRAMNSFLGNAVGMRFTGGTFAGAEWSADVHNGMAVGKMVPRWHDLHVELPGVARGDSSVVGGIMRGVAKLAANTFGIRGTNDSGSGHGPIDASITHQWVPTETLPQFIWFQLRDPLLLILRK